MKIQIGFSDLFMSPVTGKLASWTMLPSLERGHIWEGGKAGEPFPSPSLIEMKLDIKNIKYDIDDIYDTAFVLQYPDKDFPNAVTLTEMAAGLRKTQGLQTPDISYVLTTDLHGILNLTPASYYATTEYVNEQTQSLGKGTVTSISTGSGLTTGMKDPSGNILPITSSGTISIADNPTLPGDQYVVIPGGQTRPNIAAKGALRYTG